MSKLEKQFYSTLNEFIDKLCCQYPDYDSELKIGKTAVNILRIKDSLKIPVNWVSAVSEHRDKIFHSDIEFFKKSIDDIVDENIKILFEKIKEISEQSNENVISSIFKYLQVLTILSEQIMAENKLEKKSYKELKEDIQSSYSSMSKNLG